MSERPALLFLGGNGHAPVRLDAAREAVEELPVGRRFEIRDVLYPGFAGQPNASDLSSFLEGVERAAEEALAGTSNAVVHATGVGALVVLGLRARGSLSGVRTILLGPVLWGLETRWFPRLMRVPGVASAATRILQLGPVRRRFARKHFGSAEPAFVSAFFDGYVQCRHFADLFRWFTPAWLRRMEVDLAATPGALDGIELWWGAEDAVVGEQEADLAEAALGVRWPRRSFATWGHYPMIDQPREWAEEVARVLAPAVADT